MEFDIVQIRIVLLLVMLGIGGVYDLKIRKIPDILWLVFGGIGAILYIWDYSAMTITYHIITIITSTFVGVTIWRWRIAGLADCFAVIAMVVILPVHYEFVMMPIVILVMTFFIVIFSTIIYNISLNLSDMIRTKKWIFLEFKSESRYKKTFAFLVIHRKRKYEKFVISAEKPMNITHGIKSFAFLSSRNKITRDTQLLLQSNVVYVQNIPPLIAYMFGVTVFVFLPKFLQLLL